MTDILLRYRSHALIEDLALGECTIHRASDARPEWWWQLWFHVRRDTDGQPGVFSVPVRPNGPCGEFAPGRRLWGLTCPVASGQQVAPGTKNWLISPSINVLAYGHAFPGAVPGGGPSLWHHTPEILGVPTSEQWTTEGSPL